MSAAIFNHAATRISQIATAGMFPDTCTIQTENPSSDGAGGFTYGTPTSTYTSIPCFYRPFSGTTVDANGKMITFSGYKITLPVIYNSARVNIDPTTQRIVVDARGSELAKTFRIDAVPDQQGIVYEVLATKEN